MPQGKEEVLGSLAPIGLNGVFLTEMYSTRTWKVNNISVWTIYGWKCLFIGFLKTQSVTKSKLGFMRNLQKCKQITTSSNRDARLMSHGGNSIAGCAPFWHSLGYFG